MSMWGGIGGALQNIGGNMMQMAFSDMQDKKIEARKKQEQEAMRLLEETRVARTQPYKSPADPKAQSPWISKEAGGYVTPQGKPEQWMVEEFNSQGKPIGSRPASMSEDQQYRYADELAKQKALADAGDLAWKQEERGMKRTKADLDKRKGEQSIKQSKASEAYMRAGGGRNATPVDPFSTESDLSYLVSSKEGGEALDAAYQAELQKAFIAAKELKLGEAEVAATRRELARDYILKLKRLPNKSNKEESTSSFSAGGLTKE